MIRGAGTPHEEVLEWIAGYCTYGWSGDLTPVKEIGPA